jgi:ferric-dicitrate binding protein FerR (iron transport regulator)
VATVEHVMGFVRLGSEPLEPTGDLAAGTLLETGEGRAGLLLLGGTALRLDTWTRVRLDGPGRISLDRGAIYLDSGEAGRGVAVVTAEGVVRDLGTRFEVRSAAGTLRVRVRAGAVVIERADGRGERADAGTETTVRDGRLTRRAFSPADPEWGWTLRASPGFVLEGRSLADFLDWVSRETGRSWRLAEGAERRSPSTIVLHGSVAGMSPDEGLAAVLPTCGLTHRVREGVIEVVPAEGESSSDGPPAAPEAP